MGRRRGYKCAVPGHKLLEFFQMARMNPEIANIQFIKTEHSEPVIVNRDTEDLPKLDIDFFFPLEFDESEVQLEYTKTGVRVNSDIHLSPYEIGQLLYRSSKYELAIKYFSAGIAQCKQDKRTVPDETYHDCLLHRALTYLQCNQILNASRDCRVSIETNDVVN